MSRLVSAQRVATLVGDFPRSPAYLGLAESLRVLIGDGRIGIEVRLPSERDLTAALDVSRTTVTRAYEVLREMPGLGTISNAVVVGLSADATLAVLDRPEAMAGRLGLMVGGVLLCGLASALYIGAQLGRGPRDGLMTGLSRRTGLSLRLVRTGLEVSVVVIGLLLGGVLGVGTVVYALAIGPLTQLMLPWFTVDLMAPGGAPTRD